MSENTIRVLLADTCPVTKIGISTIISNEGRFILIEETAESDQALILSQKLKPDVLVLNFNTFIPNANMSEKFAYLSKLCSEAKVLLLSFFDDFHTYSLLKSGVAGYMLIHEKQETLINAIYTIARGHTWYSKSILERMTQAQTENLLFNQEFDLTRREQEVLSLIAKGWNNCQIATSLCIAEQTVRNYVSRIYSKLDLSSRAEAIIWTRDNNLDRQMTIV
jgi:DNA-binding NarL/FixJ family response regulator